jgi:hypothetical protein
MSDETKNLVDVFLALGAMAGAAIAFLHTLREWRSSQRWKRSEYLDKFVEAFERDELVRLGCTAVDWTSRNTTFRQQELQITNNDVLLALRPHEEMDPGERYAGNQAIIREAYDALFGFFCRLEIAVQSRLVDEGPARSYFKYWLERLVRLDRHPDTDRVLQGSPEEMVAKYAHAYSDVEAVCRLCEAFQVSIPVPLIHARAALRREQEIGSMLWTGQGRDAQYR